jgi:transglycosylase-like protein with SLT domain
MMFGEWNSLGDLGDCSSLRAQITAVANQYGIDPNVAYNQLQQESGCSPTVCSSKGACGIAQFMPATWLEWGTSNPADRTDVTASLDAWGAYFSDLLKANGGDYSLALAAYNAGQGNVNKYGGIPPFAETQNYVSRILAGLNIGSSSTASTASTASTDTSGSVSMTSPDVLSSGVSSDFLSSVSPIVLVGLAIAAVYFMSR